MIWLLRHGEAEDGSPDAERKLTEKGERQSRVAGAALKKLGVKPDACLASPKVRAADTAKLACEPLAVNVQLEPKLAGGPFDADELPPASAMTCCSWATIPTSRWPCTP